MTSHQSGSRVITTTDVRAFFQQSVVDAIDRHQVSAREETVVYLVNLLARFTRSERFYEWTPQGLELSPLALLYGDAVHTRLPEQRRVILQRLGDVALFVAGLFADSLKRSLVDVDYYIAMGETAYGTLGEDPPNGGRGQASAGIFNELSCRFGDFVDVVADVADNSERGNNEDVLRLYELWMRTGSRRAARKLREVGIEVTMGSASNTSH
jgi:hypothetical protein